MFSFRVPKSAIRDIERFQKEHKLQTRSDAARTLLTQGLERYVPPRHMSFEQALIDLMRAQRSFRQALKNHKAEKAQKAES